MADDIFLTPEEQDERAKKWLKDNGMSIAVGISLGLAGVVGYNQYKDNVQVKAEQASNLYNTVLNTVEESQIAEISAQVEQLKNEYANTSYAAKGALINAKQLSVSNQQAALSELQWVIDNAPEVGLQHAARIRMAKLQLSLGEFDAAKRLANVQPTNGFDSNYQEILGDIARKEGDNQAARGYYEKATEGLTGGARSYSQVLSMKLSRLPEDDTVELGDASQAGSTEENATEEAGAAIQEQNSDRKGFDNQEPSAAVEGVVDETAEQVNEAGQ